MTAPEALPEPPPGGSADDFEAAYGPIGRTPEGDLLWHTDLAGHPVQHIWTVVDGDDETLWVVAGMHVVNRVGYVTSATAWVSGDEMYRWDS